MAVYNLEKEIVDEKVCFIVDDNDVLVVVFSRFLIYQYTSDNKYSLWSLEH